MLISYLREAANVLLNLDKTLNKLQQVQVTQGRINTTITQLTAEITKIKKNVLQVFIFFETNLKKILNVETAWFFCVPMSCLPDLSNGMIIG